MLVGTITDDKRLYELPKLRVVALRFTETARARILKVTDTDNHLACQQAAVAGRMPPLRRTVDCRTFDRASLGGRSFSGCTCSVTIVLAGTHVPCIGRSNI